MRHVQHGVIRGLTELLSVSVSLCVWSWFGFPTSAQPGVQRYIVKVCPRGLSSAEPAADPHHAHSAAHTPVPDPLRHHSQQPPQHGPHAAALLGKVQHAHLSRYCKRAHTVAAPHTDDTGVDASSFIPWWQFVFVSCVQTSVRTKSFTWMLMSDPHSHTPH